MSRGNGQGRFFLPLWRNKGRQYSDRRFCIALGQFVPKSRFIAPMDLSEYVFRVQDLPMLISGVFLALYVVYLVVLLLRYIMTNRRRELTLQSTRIINPKLGFLGLLGFAGFLGFWTYSVDKTIFPFVFFLFFGFFGFFYEGKMSNTFIDERYKENKMKAQSVANKTSLSIIFLQYSFWDRESSWIALNIP